MDELEEIVRAFTHADPKVLRVVKCIVEERDALRSSVPAAGDHTHKDCPGWKAVVRHLSPPIGVQVEVVEPGGDSMAFDVDCVPVWAIGRLSVVACLREENRRLRDELAAESEALGRACEALADMRRERDDFRMRAESAEGRLPSAN